MSNNIMKYVVPVRKSVPKRSVVRYRPKYVRKRTYKPKYKRNYIRPYTKLMRQPVAEKVYTKMRYSEGITITMPTGGVLYNYSFQSSLFDPDLTATGHQPLWRDTYASMYSRYRVNGIGYKIYCRNTDVQQMSMFFVQHSSVTTLDTSVNTLIERGTARKYFLDAMQGRTNVIKGYLSVAKVYGMSRNQFGADDGFDADIGSNPSKMAYLHLMASHRHTGNNVVNVQVELTYYVEFFNRINIAGS